MVILPSYEVFEVEEEEGRHEWGNRRERERGLRITIRYQPSSNKPCI